MMVKSFDSYEENTSENPPFPEFVLEKGTLF